MCRKCAKYKPEIQFVAETIGLLLAIFGSLVAIVRGGGMTESVDKEMETDRRAGAFSPMRSLKFRLQVLFLLVALPAIVIILLLGVQERQNVMDAYRQEARKITKQLGLRQSRLIAETRLFLTDLAQTSAVLVPSDAACGAFLAQVLPLKPQYVNIFVLRTNGDVLCSAQPLNKNTNLPDSPYIRRALGEQAFSVGSIQLDPVTDVASVGFAYPVKSNPGTKEPIAAVVAVALLDWWSDAMSDEGLPDGSIALITDNTGLIVAIFPKYPEMLGRKVTEIGFTEEIIRAGTGEFSNHPDGLNRVFSHQTLFSSPDQGRVQMSLGLPIGAGLSAATRRVIIHLAIFGAFCLFAG